MSPEKRGKGQKKGQGSGSGRKKGPPKGTSPTAKRQQKRREEKLALVREQIEDGSLTIRQMTPEERKKYPPRTKKEDN
ncbi:MAG TPA: hypothetical protein VK920_10195 [Solirubrobacterales bacterium]|nr:hypothetical protein [Solirubrobacterales bacterium]